MPDEPVVDTSVTPPALDQAALGKQVADAATAAVKAALASGQQVQQPVVQAEPEPVDALGEVLAPYINKQAGRAALIAQLAADKADFYMTEDPEQLAERLHFKEEIEKRVLNLANVGRALPRADVYNHLKGEQEDKVTEFRGKRRKAREDVARGAQDFGGGSMDREGGHARLVTADQAYDLQTSGKLDEALNDKSF